MQLSLVTNPIPKRRVFLVLIWHDTMASLPFKLNQLFIVQMPLVILHIPNEPNVFQKSLSIKSNCVFARKLPLFMNPSPKRCVFLVPTWHDTIAVFSFKLDKLFILLIPLFIINFPHHDGSFRFVLFRFAVYSILLMISLNQSLLVDPLLLFDCCMPWKIEHIEEEGEENKKLPRMKRRETSMTEKNV
jgi:hypothetical protein